MCGPREAVKCKRWTGIGGSICLLISCLTGIVYTAWVISSDRHKYGTGDSCRFLGLTAWGPPPTSGDSPDNHSVGDGGCLAAVVHWDCQENGNISYPLHSATAAPAPPKPCDEVISSTTWKDNPLSPEACGLAYQVGVVYLCPLAILRSGPNATTPATMQCSGPVHEYWIEGVFWMAIGLLAILTFAWIVLGVQHLHNCWRKRQQNYNQM